MLRTVGFTLILNFFPMGQMALPLAFLNTLWKKRLGDGQPDSPTVEPLAFKLALVEGKGFPSKATVHLKRPLGVFDKQTTAKHLNQSDSWDQSSGLDRLNDRVRRVG